MTYPPMQQWMNEWMYLIELNTTENNNESNMLYLVEMNNKKYHWETEKRNERTGTKDLFSTKRNERTNNMGWNRNSNLNHVFTQKRSSEFDLEWGQFTIYYANQ